MDIDPTKAPRTYAAWKKAYDVQELAKFMVELSQQLEVELNTAIVNEAFAENKVHMLEKQLKQANEHIERLEQAGDGMRIWITVIRGYLPECTNIWRKAKEQKPSARQPERELNESNKIIRQQQLLDEENLMLMERIKRLEEAGQELLFDNDNMANIYRWHKAKEAK